MPEEFYTNRSALCPPPFQRNDFELKPQYYTLVGNHTFHAHPTEHPMDHIEKFEDLASSIKANGVSEDYLFCKLFPYSLAGEAARWLKQLKPGSLTTWKDTKKAFLENFYDDAKSEDLRNMIAQFSQGPAETFKAVWLRFKAYQRDCPHHGFDEVQLLRTFFSGIDWRYQVALDGASDGNFKTRRPREANKLIENLATSNSSKNADFERKGLAAGLDNGQMAEVKAKFDTVHNLLVNKKSVHFAQEVEVFESDDGATEEDVNYVNGSGFNGQRYDNYQGNFKNYGQNNQRGNYGNNQNSSGYMPKTDAQNGQRSNNNFTRTYGNSYYQTPPTKTPDFELKDMLERILEEQQKMTIDFNGKIDALYTDLHGKCDSLNNHIKRLDSQFVQSVANSKRPEGVLPGRTDTNPKYQCSTILSWGEMVNRGSSREDLMKSEVRRTLNKLVRELVSIDAAESRRSTHTKDSEDQDVLTCIDRRTPARVDRRTPPTEKTYLKKLPKLEESVKFAVPCSIVGVNLNNSLCDTGSSVNVMPMDIATRLGICYIKDCTEDITLVDASVKTSTGLVEDLQVKVGDCLLPCDFHVVEMANDAHMPLILGRPFLATAGALVDMPSKKISLRKMDPHMFDDAIPYGCAMLSPKHVTEEIDKGHDQEVNEIHSRELGFKEPKIVVKKKPRRSEVSDRPPMILTHVRKVDDAIEYKIKSGSFRSPFAKVRAIITSEFKEKGQATVDDMMGRVLRAKMLDPCEDDPGSEFSEDPPPA
ncbi:hypothetical protein V5N11_014345 [Cardamine amara subsp. amara]|uniref:Retrotransposon gag domain-containing protein n=1 Tax=Cardamine amara subsp. amara TaxID=228776 RepID=A0ABD1A9N3_CARAN